MATTASPPPFDAAVSLTNSCASSQSPYIRSHASNPTAWQLWTPETLELARRTNRLLFVSIGYSACHWCHVMAHESFSDPRIAQLLNEHFIPVKVDREERPDVDRQYMDFLQATTGGGGWPLNVFATPELEPIHGGTYWPGPDSERLRKGGGGGFEEILVKIARVWREQEQKCRESAGRITQQLREFAQEGTLADGKEGEGLELDVLDEAYQHYKQRFDARYGGFGGAPKFPTCPHLRALLRLSAHAPAVREVVGEKECAHARDMAVQTLEHMAKGGIKDQIGHGFARYSVTRDWSLPHFEKMLYDNAQLLSLYLDAWLLTKRQLFLETVNDIATYLTSEPMISPLGGFHASEDADSLPSADEKEKKEGAYYVWTFDEIRSILDEQEAKVCAKYWDIRPKGNVDPRFDPQGELAGQNTLSIRSTPAELAREFHLAESEVLRLISSTRQKLAAHRNAHRPRPALDDKLLTSWNGLAISGLSRAGAALASPDPEASSRYLTAARRAVDCIRTHLFDPSTATLRRVYRSGPGDTPGFADDYAFFISGLLDLYESGGFDSSYLSLADTLQATQNKLFWDAQRGGFFSTPANQPDVLVRTKDAMDNAEPSTNGIAAANLFRLASLLDDEGYATMARETVAAFEVEIAQHPGLFTGMLGPLVAARMGGMRSLLVSGQAGSPLVEKTLALARENVRPNVTILRVGGGVQDEWVRGRNELVRDLDAGREMVQICEQSVCRLVSVEEIEGLFGEMVVLDAAA